MAQEAYDREVSSAGFWPGGNGIDYPAFYAYAYPAPGGYRGAQVRPEAAFWHEGLSEFVLPYDAVQAAADPDEALMAFLVSTYEAAADLGRLGPRAAGMRTGAAAPSASAERGNLPQRHPRRPTSRSSGKMAHRRGATAWSSTATRPR